jgi:hypothetical protein
MRFTSLARMILVAILIHTSFISAISDPDFYVSPVIANVSSTDTQSVQLIPVISNNLGVQANRTVTIENSAINNGDYFIIGLCRVNFTRTWGATVDEKDCADGVVTLDTDKDFSNTVRTVSDYKSVFASLTNVYDAAHGLLRVS